MPPDSPDSTGSIADLIALFQRGAYSDVIAAAHRLRAAHPREPLIDVVAGAAHSACGNWDAAIASHRRALAIDPQFIDAHYNLGRALQQSGDLAAAEVSYSAVVARAPGHAQAHNNLGVVLKQQGSFVAARTALESAVAAAPALLDAHVNLAGVLGELRATAAAEAHFLAVLDAAPDLVDAWYNYGVLLTVERRLPEAVTAFTRASEAIANNRHALTHNTEEAAIWTELGSALAESGEDDTAMAAWRKALLCDPAHHRAIAFLLHRQAYLADWSQRGQAILVDPAAASPKGPASPFIFLAFEDNPAEHRLRAEAFSRHHFAAIPAVPLERPGALADRRIRVGYFSADFHDHATLYLMAGVLRCHDRARFEIHAYSFGAYRTGAARREAEQNVEHFHDVADLSECAITALAQTHGLDIAVDLKGYTRDARTAIFARRLAPVQLNYLGYPGTMGAPFIDYIIADMNLIPSEQRAHYSEALIQLPDSYQPNDDHRAVALTADTRTDHGLPEGSFVFASFNNTYKIGPAEYDIWCRLLHAVPGSVLWLLRCEGRAGSNLQREAEARGIDPQRLVFAPDLPQELHLARLRHADLFLDSFAYNAHTTASDALWGGLPVLTMAGRGFAARVASSLLRAIDLPELVTTNMADYEALGLALARDPERLGAIRARLAHSRTTCALFDTARYTRNLETGFTMAVERCAAGLPPGDLVVPDCGPMHAHM